MTRPEYRSETRELDHVDKNVFRYGSAVVTKYLDGYCEATIGNAMRWTANSERELIDKMVAAGYGKEFN